MGSVYDVEDVTVGKRYVLKTLHPQLVSRHDLAKRMEAEARTLAKLQHPNIVDVVTAGVTTDERRMPFYVMERLNGQNLRVVLEKKGSLELPHCYRIAIDVLDALEHAHENAVIHRDVKPENIFLHRNTNGTTTTKLLDFGIMRLLDRKASHTQGKFIGTLRYASPEQIMGGDLGPATDIYSLGIVLYEMIAGRGPFDDAGDAYAIGAAHAQVPPPPLSRFAPSVPPVTARLVMSAIAKNPHERPRDSFSFASELRRLLREEEAGPRSATAVNVLSSVPDTRAANALPLPSSEPPAGPPAVAVGTATEVGMSPPSLATVQEGRGSGARQAAVAGSPGATDLGTAPTVASDPAGVSAPGGAAVVTPPMHGMHGSVPRAAAQVDRAAATRTSGAVGFTQRLALNGTAVDDAPALAPEEDVRAALAQREPLEVPPTSGAPHEAQGRDIVFPQAGYHTTGTGPLAGEARTRPPERGVLLPLVLAGVAALLLVTGAVVVVKKPWLRAPAAATAAPSAVTLPPAVSTPALPAAETPPSPSLPSAPAPAASTSAPAQGTPVQGTVPGTASSVRVVPGRPTVTTKPGSAPPAVPAAPPAPATAKKPPRAPGPVRPEDVGFD